MTQDNRMVRWTRSLLLVAGMGAALGTAAGAEAALADPQPAPQTDRCVADGATTEADLSIRQARNDWALQCGYITQRIYDYLYQGNLSWKFVSFARNDREDGYPLWRPEDSGQLEKDAGGHFLRCEKPEDVRFFTMCTVPTDG